MMNQGNERTALVRRSIGIRPGRRVCGEVWLSLLATYEMAREGLRPPMEPGADSLVHRVIWEPMVAPVRDVSRPESMSPPMNALGEYCQSGLRDRGIVLTRLELLSFDLTLRDTTWFSRQFDPVGRLAVPLTDRRSVCCTADFWPDAEAALSLSLCVAGESGLPEQPFGDVGMDGVLTKALGRCGDMRLAQVLGRQDDFLATLGMCAGERLRPTTVRERNVELTVRGRTGNLASYCSTN